MTSVEEVVSPEAAPLDPEASAPGDVAQDASEPRLLRELAKATLSHSGQPDSVHART